MSRSLFVRKYVLDLSAYSHVFMANSGSYIRDGLPDVVGAAAAVSLWRKAYTYLVRVSTTRCTFIATLNVSKLLLVVPPHRNHPPSTTSRKRPRDTLTQQKDRIVAFIDRHADIFGQHMPHQQATFLYLGSKKVAEVCLYHIE